MQELPADIILERATVQQYRGSSPQLVARTPSLTYFRQGNRAGQIEASDVVIDLRSNGLHLEAAEVSGSAITSILDGKAVHAVTQSQVVVNSKAAHFNRYEGPSGTASTDAGVLVLHPSFTITAESGKVDLETEEASLAVVRTRTGKRSPEPR